MYLVTYTISDNGDIHELVGLSDDFRAHLSRVEEVMLGYIAASRPPRRKRAKIERCKGIKPNGKPCRGYRKPGTAFCQHHQDQAQELQTLACIVGELGGAP